MIHFGLAHDAAAVLIGWLVAVVVIGGGIGFLIGKNRRRPVLGFFVGLFGIFGWILLAVLPRTPEAEAARNLAVAQKMASMSPQTS